MRTKEIARLDVEIARLSEEHAAMIARLKQSGPPETVRRLMLKGRHGGRQ